MVNPLLQSVRLRAHGMEAEDVALDLHELRLVIGHLRSQKVRRCSSLATLG